MASKSTERIFINSRSHAAHTSRAQRTGISMVATSPQTHRNKTHKKTNTAAVCARALTSRRRAALIMLKLHHPYCRRNHLENVRARALYVPMGASQQPAKKNATHQHKFTHTHRSLRRGRVSRKLVCENKIVCCVRGTSHKRSAQPTGAHPNGLHGPCASPRLSAATFTDSLRDVSANVCMSD